jgi:hypothetical protein
MQALIIGSDDRGMNPEVSSSSKFKRYDEQQLMSFLFWYEERAVRFSF